MKKPAQHILDRYFANHCTEQEASQVLDWLATPEGQAYYSRILDERIEQFDSDPTHVMIRSMDDEKVLQSIYEQADASEQENTKRRKRINWYSVAAVLAGLCIGGYTFWMYVHHNTIAYTTGYGEVRTIILEDSSVVTLNANSTLSYHPEGIRDIYLEGEAYFSVRHMPEHKPFVVHAGKVEVQVLGTEFNVNSRRKETEVVLRSGKVKLDVKANADMQEMMMAPGDKVTYAEGKKDVVRQIVNTDKYTSWRNNRLIFDHTPLKEIAQLLEDNYGLQVVVEDPAMLDWQFSAEVSADHIDLLLKLLEKSFSMSVTKTKNQVLMKKN